MTMKEAHKKSPGFEYSPTPEYIEALVQLRKLTERCEKVIGLNSRGKGKPVRIFLKMIGDFMSDLKYGANDVPTFVGKTKKFIDEGDKLLAPFESKGQEKL